MLVNAQKMLFEEIPVFTFGLLITKTLSSKLIKSKLNVAEKIEVIIRINSVTERN